MHDKEKAYKTLKKIIRFLVSSRKENNFKFERRQHSQFHKFFVRFLNISDNLFFFEFAISFERSTI